MSRPCAYIYCEGLGRAGTQSGRRSRNARQPAQVRPPAGARQRVRCHSNRCQWRRGEPGGDDWSGRRQTSGATHLHRTMIQHIYSTSYQNLLICRIEIWWRKKLMRWEKNEKLCTVYSVCGWSNSWNVFCSVRKEPLSLCWLKSVENACHNATLLRFLTVTAYRPHSTTPTPTSSRGCRRVGRLPRSACHGTNFRKSRVWRD